MVFVGGIAEGGEVGVVRSDDVNPGAIASQPMKLLDGADEISKMLDDVNHANPVETRHCEGIREMVQVYQDVRARCWIPVDADRAGEFVHAATDVKDPHLFILTRQSRFYT